MVMIVICVFLGVVCALLFARLLPLLCAILAAVWLWNLDRDHGYFVDDRYLSPTLNQDGRCTLRGQAKVSLWPKIQVREGRKQNAS